MPFQKAKCRRTWQGRKLGGCGGGPRPYIQTSQRYAWILYTSLLSASWPWAYTHGSDLGYAQTLSDRLTCSGNLGCCGPDALIGKAEHGCIMRLDSKTMHLLNDFKVLLKKTRVSRLISRTAQVLITHPPANLCSEQSSCWSRLPSYNSSAPRLGLAGTQSSALLSMP